MNSIKQHCILFLIAIGSNTILLDAFKYPYHISPSSEDDDLQNTNNIIEKTKNVLTDTYNDTTIINNRTTVRTVLGDFTLLSLLLLFPESSELSYSLANSILTNNLFTEKSKRATLFNIIMFDARYPNERKNIEEMLKVLINHGGQLPDDDGTDYSMVVLKNLIIGRNQEALKQYLKLVKNNSKVDNSLFFGSDGKAKSKDDSDVKFFKPQKKSESKNDESNAENDLTLFAQALKNIAG